MPEKTGSYIDYDVYAKQLGIEVLESSSVDTLCKLTINDSQLNGVGSIHGAVIFALADITFAVACNVSQAAIGMQADIRYLNRPKGEELLARARLISASKKIAHYQVDVTDDEGNKIAQFSGTAYKLPQT
jgi:acyl-CoA thioesterase